LQVAQDAVSNAAQRQMELNADRDARMQDLNEADVHFKLSCRYVLKILIPNILKIWNQNNLSQNRLWFGGKNINSEYKNTF